MLFENDNVNVGDTLMFIDALNGPVEPVKVTKITKLYIFADGKAEEYAFHHDGCAAGYVEFHLAIMTSELEEDCEKKRLRQDILGTRAMEDLLAGISLENLSLKRLQRMKQVKDDLLKEVYGILDILQDETEKTALDKEEL